MNTQTYTWFAAINELCLQLDSETTIDDVLTTAVDENMITLEQAKHIALEVGLEGSQFSPHFIGATVLGYFDADSFEI
jgi:hypothetical protein